ncbi:MAG: HAMP domain-containing histidine kinase [Chloroflexi bacterium]|nr:HAMP domain-containing histidine kinase [Chloroflexota bacterium]
MVLQYAANQVIDPTGKLLNLMFTFIDVTEQKKAEELARQVQHERELRELKSRFVSMLVHDFRNPLTSLQMSLSLIEKYTETFSLDQIREKLSAAQRQSANINQLVDDVLMIGKIEHLSSIFSPEQVELVGFCRTLFEDVAASISERHNLRFETRIEEFRYPVDPALLRRALTNLLANAVKYSPAGGSITTTLSTEKSAFCTARERQRHWHSRGRSETHLRRLPPRQQRWQHRRYGSGLGHRQAGDRDARRLHHV